MFKKILLSLLLVVTLFQSTLRPVAAAGWYDSSLFDWYGKVYDVDTSPANEIFGERYTAAQVQWVMYGLIVFPMHLLFSSEFTACILRNAALPGGGGTLMAVCGQYIFDRIGQYLSIMAQLMTYSSSEPSNLAVNDKSLIQSVFQERPFSAITYAKDFYGRITLVKDAQAQQGFGFSALNSVQKMWTTSRNISYGLLIFAAIIMAFMVMMRTKISPQVVITAQSSIPKLVAAIILITFSYAIAGLMIDFLYVIIGIIAAIMSESPDQTASLYQTMTAGPGGTGLLGMIGYYTLFFPILFVLSLFDGASGFLGSLLNSSPVLFFFIIICFVLLGFVMFFAIIKIFMMLVKALVNIYILTIFGPFYILGGTLTQALGFGNWVKEMASNLLVFPGVGLLFIFGLRFMQPALSAFANNPDVPSTIHDNLVTFATRLGLDLSAGGPTQGWAPPFLFGGLSTEFILLIVSLGVILLIPKVADIIKGFMSGRPFAYGTAIGEASTSAVKGSQNIAGAWNQGKTLLKARRLSSQAPSN